MKLNTLPEKKFTKEKSMKKVIALSALVMSLAATSAFASCPCQLQQKAYIPVAPIQKVTYVAPADPCCCKNSLSVQVWARRILPGLCWIS